MISRDAYLSKLIDNKDNGFPKIVTGIRRCGKSFLLKEIYAQYLIDNGVAKDCILIIELDDDRNIALRDPIVLGDRVRAFCNGKTKCYVFLDEIQKVYKIVNPNLTEGKHCLAKESDMETVSFVDVVLGLSREPNIDLYVTGSNSKMLSSDVVTEFRDKAISIKLSPLSFEEFYNYVGKSETDALYEYLQFGGMPLTVLKNENEKKDYLKSLFETTYYRDIIERNKLKKSEALDELCRIVSASTGGLLNSEKIANTYKSKRREKIDKLTVEKYVRSFVDSFILNVASRYDVKGRSEIGALRKYYFTDIGLRNAVLNFAYTDEGILLENMAYNELLYKGYSVNVGTFESVEKDEKGKSVRKTNEIDFYAVKGTRKFYVQVTNDIGSAETRARELRPYMILNDNIEKIIVVNKPVHELLDENNFKIIGITDFLLKYI